METQTKKAKTIQAIRDYWTFSKEAVTSFANKHRRYRLRPTPKEQRQRRTQAAIVVLLLVVGVGIAALMASRADAVEQAIASVKRLAGWQAKVDVSLANLKKHLAELRPDKPSTVQAAVQDYKQLIPQLRKTAMWLLNNRGEFDINMLEYRKALLKAAKDLRAAADQYRGFAKEAKEKVFAEHYEQLATQAEAAAAGLEAEADRLQDVRKDVAKKLTFLSEAATFLDRLELFVQLLPAADRSRLIEEFVRDLNDFVERFEKTLDSFALFSEKLAQQPTEKPAEAEKTIATTK